MDNRYRPRSPPGRRAYHDPRASTGFISTSFEPAYPSYPRSAIDPYTSTRHGSIYEPPPPKRYPYQPDPYAGTTTRTEYPVSAYNRPRNNSTMSTEGRRPLSMIAKNSSPPRYKPVVSNLPRDVPRSPPLGPSSARGEPSRYLIPARSGGSEHHQRHYSATRTESDRLIPAARGPRRSEYHQPGGYDSSKGYAGARGVKDDDFSYTGPREQFDRDYPVRSSQTRDPYVRRERPVSVMELPEHKPPPPRRDMGPPQSVPRQPDRLEPVPVRRSGFDSDPDRSSDLPQRRHSMRAPVVHQHRDDNYGPPRDDFDRPAPKVRRDRLDDDDAAAIKARQRELDAQYERESRREREKEIEQKKERDYQRERERELRERDREKDRDRERDRDGEKPRERERDRDKDRERERERPRQHNHDKSKRADDERDASPNRSGSGIAKAAAAGLAGAGATAVANAVLKSKKPDEASDSDERKERRHRHHRHRQNDEDTSAREAEPARERRSKEAIVPADDRAQYDSGYGTSKRGDESSESHEDESGKRRHRRSRRHQDRDDASGLPEARLAPPDAHGDREPSSGEDGTGHRRRRDKSRNRELEAAARELEHRTVSPGENDDDRPRRVQLVEPVDKREEVKPRGILKPSRTTPFPEDPNPTREGVAPLKEAGKQGVPPGARWTKISRLLVNPEALEKSHERFEERDEYVIVLRVMTREEIAKFAEKTQEIRAERERQWKEEVERRGLNGDAIAIEGPRPVEPFHEGAGGEGEPRLAAIEARPAATAGNDVQTLLDPGAQRAPEGVPVPVSVLVPDIKLDESATANYSTNV